MLSHVTFTGWDRHTDLAELQTFLEDCRQATVEIAVLYSSSRSADDEDRYPDVGKAEAILRTAKAAGQRTALHVCGSAAQDLLRSVDEAELVFPWNAHALIGLADRVQVNVGEDFWPPGLEKYRAASRLASALERPVIVQTRDVEAWPQITHPQASRMVPFLFDRSAGAGVEMHGWPDPPFGRLVGYAGGLGPDNVGELLARLAEHPGAHIWIDMETRIRESFPVPERRPDEPPPATYVSLTKCQQVMAAIAPWLKA